MNFRDSSEKLTPCLDILLTSLTLHHPSWPFIRSLSFLDFSSSLCLLFIKQLHSLCEFYFASLIPTFFLWLFLYCLYFFLAFAWYMWVPPNTLSSTQYFFLWIYPRRSLLFFVTSVLQRTFKSPFPTLPSLPSWRIKSLTTFKYLSWKFY